MVPPPKEGSVQRVVRADDLKIRLGNRTVRKGETNPPGVLVGSPVCFLTQMPCGGMGGCLRTESFNALLDEELRVHGLLLLPVSNLGDFVLALSRSSRRSNEAKTRMRHMQGAPFFLDMPPAYNNRATE
jgi:hypothetical protein